LLAATNGPVSLPQTSANALNSTLYWLGADIRTVGEF